MSVPFDSQQGLIVVRAELFGPNGSAAHDTGATSTVVSVGMLVAIGYDPALVSDRVQVTTGSGIEFAPRQNDLKKLRNAFVTSAMTRDARIRRFGGD